MYKPYVVTNRKVDALIGNPPWAALQFMKNKKYQEYLKNRSRFYELPGKSQNIAHIEHATLFFCQCVQQYLNNNGLIAFVMPKSVLVASQHQNFLKFRKPLMKLTKIYDLEDVYPLFKIPSCVLFSEYGKST